MAICKQPDWEAVNLQYASYYYENYPWLEVFPPMMADLQSFYVWDMKERNLTPLQSFKDCYELIFSYALAQMPEVGKSNRFTGQTFFQRLVKDQWRGQSILWTAIVETGDDLKKGLDWFEKLLPVIAVFLLIYFFKD